MKLIQQITVKLRLWLILIFLIMFGIIFASFSINRINTIAHFTKEMHEHPFKVSNASISASKYLAKSRNVIKDILYSEDPIVMSQQKIYIETYQMNLKGDLDIVRDRILGDEGKNIEIETRKLYNQWVGLWEEEVYHFNNGNVKQALNIHKNQGKAKADELEQRIEKLINYSLNKADEFALNADKNRIRGTWLFISIFLIGMIFFSIITVVISKSILSNLLSLKETMSASAQEGKLIEAEVAGKNEITDMAINYNNLLMNLKNQNWITEGKNLLRVAISENMPMQEFVDKALSTASRHMNAGSAVFYVYDDTVKSLNLLGTYAFVARDELSNEYKLGSGIIGQVARELKPILLRDIRKDEAIIASGTLSVKPLCAYAFPLTHDGALLGVVEFLFSYEIPSHVLEYMDEINRIISTNLNNNLKNDKIMKLLDDAKLAKTDLQLHSEELHRANIHLEEQQQLLNQQTEELQQANAEMEEQQQELQLMNAQLEEQKEALIHQNILMEEKNSQMDIINRDLDARSYELETANKYKSELLANMSHELRTPLNSIILLSRLLSSKQDGVFDEKEVEKVRVIHKSGVELLRLIDDILDLSKIEAGKLQICEMTFHSSNLVLEWKDMFKEIAKDKSIDFEIIDDIDANLYGDKDKISQVMRNFLSNAFKFTKEGRIEVHLSKNSDADFPYLISVSDTGIGIPKDKQKLIFDAFCQANSSITREFGGTGLGLSICKELAKLMMSQISLKSQEGKGSEFTLMLPQKVCDGSQIENKKIKTLPNSSLDCDLTDDKRNIKKGDKVILVIDDDYDFVAVIKEIVRELGFKVLIALNGQRGFELASKYMPTGILLDLKLPDMSGSKLLSKIKSEKNLSNIPVHIISGMEKDVALRKSGAIGFTTKPLSLENIEEALNKILDCTMNTVKNVLLVEDDEVQIESIVELFGPDEVAVKIVSDENSALIEIDKGVYDAIIVDLMLKSGSGLNICKYMDEKSIEIPVIIYTARSLTFEQEHELKKYSDSIILKTASSHERLLDEVRMFLHKVRDVKNESYVTDNLIESQCDGLRGKKILIVDDDAKNIFVIAAALEKLDVEVDNAHNGKEAIDKLYMEKFDLILMDIMMPVMDGYEATKRIKCHDEFKKIPIIALTAKALKGDKEKAIEAGADDYISKPLDYDVFLRLINAWINKKADK